MRNARMVVLLLAVGLARVAAADRWPLPEPRIAFAEDRSWCVVIFPKPITSQLQYFKDKSEGTENPGAESNEQQSATAAVQRRLENGGYQDVAAFALLNEVAPVDVLISSTGVVVTFDNWHMRGYGDDVVVLYRSDGTLVKQYSLEQLLSKEKIKTLPHSVSSIWWGGDHSLDEKAGHVVLLIVKENFDRENPEYEELRLDLATGEKVTNQQ